MTCQKDALFGEINKTQKEILNCQRTTVKNFYVSCRRIAAQFFRTFVRMNGEKCILKV